MDTITTTVTQADTVSVVIDTSSSDEEVTGDSSILQSLTPSTPKTQKTVISKFPTANSPFVHSHIVLDPPYKSNKFSKSSRQNPSKGKRKVTFVTDTKLPGVVEVVHSTTYRMLNDF